MEPRPLGRGNWPPALGRCGRTTAASMEPRPLGRGNTAQRRRPRLNRLRFNGATTSRSWKRPVIGLLSSGATGFNGATTSRSWRPPGPRPVFLFLVCASMEPRPLGRGDRQDRGPYSSSSSALQWSHDLSVVETSRDSVSAVWAASASMDVLLASKWEKRRLKLCEGFVLPGLTERR
jgi:hypothetical protein